MITLEKGRVNLSQHHGSELLGDWLLVLAMWNVFADSLPG
jgi:hypothetical protein